MASVIEVSGLTKRFGSLTAVNDVSFSVERGEIFGLLGKNGAGKTTTVEILEGYQSPDEGRVAVLGVEPKRGGGAWKDRIGLVLQDSDFDPSHTVAETVKLFAGFFTKPEKRGRDPGTGRPQRQGRTRGSADSPGDNVAVSTWRSASSVHRSCSSSMNPRPASTRRPVESSGRCSRDCVRPARRSC